MKEMEFIGKKFLFPLFSTVFKEPCDALYIVIIKIKAYFKKCINCHVHEIYDLAKRIKKLYCIYKTSRGQKARPCPGGF